MINSNGATYEPVLTDHIIGYGVAGAIADIVCPRVDVEEGSGKYETYGKESFKIMKRKARKGMAKADTVSFAIGEESYETKNYPIRVELTNAHIRKRAKFGRDARLEKTEEVTKLMIRQREYAVAAIFAAATNYDSLTGSDQFDHADSNPFKKIGYYKAVFNKQCGVFPSHIIMNPGIEYTIATHPTRDNKDQGKDRVTDPSLPDIFMGMKLVVGSLSYDSSKTGRTASISYLWGNNIYLVYINDDISATSPTAAKTFDGGKDAGRVQGISINEYPGDAGQDGIYIEAQEDVDEQITCQDGIYIIKDILATPI